MPLQKPSLLLRRQVAWVFFSTSNRWYPQRIGLNGAPTSSRNRNVSWCRRCMSKFYVSAWTVTKKSIAAFFEGDAFTQAAAIAFSTIFSLPAILIIALSIASTIYERDIVLEQLLAQVGKLIGADGAKEIQNILLNAVVDSSGTFARVVGVVTLVFSATTVFISLQTSLNSIWGIKPKPE